jgi:hypothetical protein
MSRRNQQAGSWAFGLDSTARTARIISVNDPLDPEQVSMPAEDSAGPVLNAALRAAFGPPSQALGRDGSVLVELRRSDGVTSRIMLRDEPDAPSPVVGLRQTDRAPAADGGGRYQLHGEIDRGGMGIVLKGRDTDLGRDIAMKVLHPAHAGNPTLVQRFVEEAQIGGQLQHPGILPVYELGLDAAQRPYFTMRLVKGRTLAALLEERSDCSFDQGRFLSVFEQVCQTVAYAHARGVIHRDLKPSNIMVGSFGEVQVVDWGLSKVLHQKEPGGEPAPSEGREDPLVETVRTTGGGLPSQAGALIGTPAYMSPEQARGEVETIDEQSDVFALGSVLCEILTGEPVYIGSRLEVLRAAADGSVDSAFARLDASGADPDLVRLAKRCLDPSRGVRLRTAGIVAKEMASYLASVNERARAAELAAAEARAKAAVDRRAGRRLAALGLALGLALSAALGLVLIVERERRTRAEQTVADVAALSWKSKWFRDQAPLIPPEQLDRWAKALAHVRRTAEIVGAAATRPETRQEVHQVVADLKREEQRVRARLQQHRSTLVPQPAERR